MTPAIKRLGSPRLREMLRFVQVGLASNLVYFGVLGLVYGVLDLVLWFGAALAYATSMAVNYTLHHRHTFRSRQRHSRALVRYFVVQAAMLSTNSLLLHLMVSQAGGRFWIAQLVAIGVVTCLSYLLSRHWVFAHRQPPP
jgi:putative flippase GtrA